MASGGRKSRTPAVVPLSGAELATYQLKMAERKIRLINARRTASTTVIDTPKVLADLEEARILAVEEGQFSAAIKASELHGRSLGMFDDGFRDKEEAPRISITNYDQRTINVNSNKQVTEDGIRVIEISASDLH
jgi:hypothetical protein